MPIRLFFPLSGPAPASPFQHSTGLRAVVLRWLELADPARSQSIHDDGRPKPHTISPIWQREGQTGFDLSLLADELLDPILAGFEASGRGARLGADRYQVGSPQTVFSSSWEELSQPAGGRTQIDIELLSPAAHHAPGPLRKSVVLPSPELYFGSWFHRCGLYAPIPMDESVLQIVQDRVAVAACSGSTRPVRLDGKRVFIGFQGSVRFGILKAAEVSAEHLRHIWTLARIAAYAGTGVETMRGMGQTMVLEG